MGALLRVVGISTLAVLALASGSSCAASHTGDRQAGVATQHLAGMSCTVSLTPAEPHAMKPFDLSVAVAEAGGSPPPGGSVAVTFSMPTMSMPEVRPDLGSPDAGVSSGRVVLPMSGAWTLEVVVGDQTPRTFAFPVTCR